MFLRVSQNRGEGSFFVTASSSPSRVFDRITGSSGSYPVYQNNPSQPEGGIMQGKQLTETIIGCAYRVYNKAHAPQFHRRESRSETERPHSENTGSTGFLKTSCSSCDPVKKFLSQRFHFFSAVYPCHQRGRTHR